MAKKQRTSEKKEHSIVRDLSSLKKNILMFYFFMVEVAFGNLFYSALKMQSYSLKFLGSNSPLFLLIFPCGWFLTAITSPLHFVFSHSTSQTVILAVSLVGSSIGIGLVSYFLGGVTEVDQSFPLIALQVAVGSITFTPTLSVLTEYTTEMFLGSVGTHVALLWSGFGFGFFSTFFGFEAQSQISERFMLEAFTNNASLLSALFSFLTLPSFFLFVLIPREPSFGSSYGLLKMLHLILNSRVIFTLVCLVIGAYWVILQIYNSLAGDVLAASTAFFGLIASFLFKATTPKNSIGLFCMVLPALWRYFIPFAAQSQPESLRGLIVSSSFALAGIVFSIQVPATFAEALKAIKEAHPDKPERLVTRSLSMLLSLFMHIVSGASLFLLFLPDFLKLTGTKEPAAFYERLDFMVYSFPCLLTVSAGLLYSRFGRN